MKIKGLLLLLFAFILNTALAQSGGTIRGNVYDEDTGEPIIYGNVLLEGTNYGTNTDFDGFFSIGNLPAGDYSLKITYLGYDSIVADIKLKEGAIVYKSLYMKPSAVNLETVNVSSRKEQSRSDVQVSKVTVTPKQIRSLPSTGGEADIAQYLPVLPGIIVSGDQGGQLYIRGGSPVQNKILLDGMTIYNPFHSIGFFSVFETETIRSVDVLTGGFNADQGGRISAIVDIKTREGDKKKLSGLVSASPFQAKTLIEGPIKKLEGPGTGSISFLLTGKHSYLDQTSKALYSYAVDTNFFSFAARDTSFQDIKKSDIGLPYTYTDVYGKLSFLGGNGSKLNLFGFNFTDRFNFIGLAKLDWQTTGAGANFTLIPPNSNVIMDGTIAISDYEIKLEEADGRPRRSAVNSYSAALNFSYFGSNSQINYGFEFTGFNTDFEFRNSLGVRFQQQDFTTELAGYFKYKQKLGNLIMEPGLRLHYYASQSEMSVEPRLGLKYNVTDFLRLKFAGGFYSQNLISTVNDLDVVNFFIGFLAGPESTLFQPGTRTPTKHNLQKSYHAVGGMEIDLTNNLFLNVEPYLKRFTQLININRNKINETDPNFITETGDAYGIDLSLRYEKSNLYLWATYSLGRVVRDDGVQQYPTIFDRRHNVNFLASYNFGKDKNWEAGLRWNLGSGFPFTQTQGFYEQNNYSDLVFTDILTGNFGLGTILSNDLNGGRLSYYHRLDASLKRTFEFSKDSKLEITLSVTNVYNRDNVFYVDRVTNSRVDQLPVLPSLAAQFSF
ncbi:MAG: carboxypeptidase-like regulatory domain-containing protein [Phaeodactylibacter sp.]|nr:carboxypeptidase-like regulatory domain-containing protein [Phaeodactylibacter sp.]MCB9264714.1 carboxypeptidase-like regulatory domain-containing protein [Lewinellaceae bacterium]MCB9287075.1 carboxypeptidase-like regulatory domain-containing protein [Lewinellaceae bacterium]